MKDKLIELLPHTVDKLEEIGYLNYPDYDMFLNEQLEDMLYKPCPLCKDGIIMLKYQGRVKCSNPHCKIHEEGIEDMQLSSSGQVIYTTLRRGYIVNNYWSINDDEFSILANEVSEIEVIVSPATGPSTATEYSRYGHKYIPKSVDKWNNKQAGRNKIRLLTVKVIDVDDDNDRLMLIDNDGNHIEVMKWYEYSCVDMDLFGVNRPKVPTPHIFLREPNFE